MNRSISYGVLSLVVCFFAMNCSGSVPTPDEAQRENSLAIIYPQTSTELVGGQSFRITIILKDYDDQPIEGVFVSAELWTPDGERFATLTCLDKKDGRYLAEPISLPLKNSQGVWRIAVRAILGSEVIAQGEGQFNARSSYSERLQQLFGFWIELSDLFPYNVSNAEDPLLKTYAYENGGYVILANNLNSGGIRTSFVILDVHWRQMDFPKDEISAANYVLNLAGPHRIALDISADDLVVEQDNFRGWPTWKVSGWWNPSNALGNSGQAAPLDWVIFHCPGSEWLWTILITTNEMEHLDELKSIRETFECSFE